MPVPYVHMIFLLFSSPASRLSYHCDKVLEKDWCKLPAPKKSALCKASNKNLEKKEREGELYGTYVYVRCVHLDYMNV